MILLDIVNKKIKKSQPIKLHVGCGSNIIDDYINVDGPWMSHEPKIAIHNLIEKYPLPDNSVDEILSVHVIANKSKLDNEESIVMRLNGPKQKSGNVMFKYILAPNARAFSVSCQMYLLRKDYDMPSNWQIYSEWTSEYYKSETARQWVATNQKFIGKL